jgi:DNA-directed RNA polymerase subunit RPC12/RpoP
MQTFTCPECGFESTFDPLLESAHCPKCGFTRQLPDRPDTAELLAPSHLLAGREPVVDLYQSAKKEAPFTVILVRQDDRLYTFGEDAQALARVFGRGVLQTDPIQGSRPPTARIPVEQRFRAIGALKQVRRQVKIADRAILTCAGCGRRTLSQEVFAPAARCSRCGFVPQELQDYVQNLIDQGVQASRRGDHQRASGYFNKAYRSQGTDQQRLTTVMWLADLSVNLYQKREYLNEGLELAQAPSDVTALQSRLRQVEALIDPGHTPPPQSGTSPFKPPDSDRPTLRPHLDMPTHTGIVPMPVYTCAACGAAFLLDSEAVSLTCPHCASNYIVQDRATQDLIPPGGLIPFSVSEDEAQDGFRDWLSQQWLIHTDRRFPPVGFYLPVWVVEMEGEVAWEGKIQRGLLPASRSGKRLVSSDDIRVAALKKIPRYLEAEVDEYDMGAMVPFDEAFLARWPAQVYTLTPSQITALAHSKALRSLRASLESFYGHIEDLSLQPLSLQALSYNLALVPIWVAHYLVGGRRYEVVINGQTGAVQGEMVDPDRNAAGR